MIANIGKKERENFEHMDKEEADNLTGVGGNQGMLLTSLLLAFLLVVT
jgi:hypothetical protein